MVSVSLLVRLETRGTWGTMLTPPVPATDSAVMEQRARPTFRENFSKPRQNCWRNPADLRIYCLMAHKACVDSCTTDCPRSGKADPYV